MLTYNKRFRFCEMISYWLEICHSNSLTMIAVKTCFVEHVWRDGDAVTNRVKFGRIIFHLSSPQSPRVESSKLRVTYKMRQEPNKNNKPISQRERAGFSMFELEIWPTVSDSSLRLNEPRLMSNQTPAEPRETGQTLRMQTLHLTKPLQTATWGAVRFWAISDANRLVESEFMLCPKTSRKEFTSVIQTPYCICDGAAIVWNCSLVKLVLAWSSATAEWVRFLQLSVPTPRLTLNPNAAAGRAETG